MTALLNITRALETRYQILQEIGRGGMGIVFHAYDKQLRENVAIKVLSPLLSHDPESLERLRREVTSARKITHPNVIKIFDIAEASGLHYITMEYFPGQNLRQWILRKGPFSLQEGLQILYQICDGLDAAHSQGIIHRDLQSQNVILNESGQVKIIDLGLARASHTEGMTATGLIMGTPEYMAPEQVLGKRVDERSDLYSLGIILYEIFNGKVPYTGDSPIAVGYKHLKEAVPSLHSTQKGLPAKLSAVAERLLQKDPAHRYQSIPELRRDLEELHEFRPVLGSAQEPSIRDSLKVRN
jgi:serine/threonine-protein kinase